jgi:NDP-sugar pyrophosphorylase family protein
MVPDTHIIHNKLYEQIRGYTYKEGNMKIARSVKIGEGCVIGSGSIIEDNVSIQRCVIGRNCIIKSGSRLSDCYIWEGEWL